MICGSQNIPGKLVSLQPLKNKRNKQKNMVGGSIDEYYNKKN